MKLRLLWLGVTALLLAVSAVAFPKVSAAHGEENTGSAAKETVAIRVEVRYDGFKITPAELEVGKKAEVTFVYKDDDLPFDNPHIIFVSGYNISAEVSKGRPEAKVSFVATKSGKIRLSCTLSCTGHDELQGGNIVVVAAGKNPSAAGFSGGSLTLKAAQQTDNGRMVQLSAVLRDSQGQPMANTPVKFLVKADFFISGLMEVGEAMTNKQGVAVLDYVPRLAGDTEVVASVGAVQTKTNLSIADTDTDLYQASAGLRLPAPGPEIFIGPEPAEKDAAPLPALRLPGGLLSWLLLLVAVVVLIWATYFRVVYQVFQISVAARLSDSHARLVPWFLMAMVLVLGTFLVLKLITGPDSHPHLAL